MIKKPIFQFWLHREMWDVLAKNPGMQRKEAIILLRQKYGDTVQHPFGEMFPCQASCSSVYPCMTVFCPLDWSSHNPGESFGCILAEGNGLGGGLLYRWGTAITENDPVSTELAEQIRDLPLSKKAHEYYVVEESKEMSRNKVEEWRGIEEEEQNILKMYPDANKENIIHSLVERYKKAHPEIKDETEILWTMIFLYNDIKKREGHEK